ncbi:unnamed protein product [Ostreobium quekettii]|uniref:Protein kinase domain-containing protein n=1 Tax=Ostreobium quekettii TaxID=121088 RepID=A0A8S1J223_9CHLO|nr:unnamed protein product [Ostreobium quekettii]
MGMCPMAQLQYDQIRHFCHTMAVPLVNAHPSIDAAKTECCITISLPVSALTGPVVCGMVLIIVAMVVLRKALIEALIEMRHTDGFCTYERHQYTDCALCTPLEQPILHCGKSKACMPQTNEGEVEGGGHLVQPAQESKGTARVCPSCLQRCTVGPSSDDMSNSKTVPKAHPAEVYTMSADLCSDGCMGGRQEEAVQPPSTEQPIRKCKGPRAVANIQVFPVSKSIRTIKVGGNGFVTPAIIVNDKGERQRVMLKEAPSVGDGSLAKQEALNNEILTFLDIPEHPHVVRVLGFSMAGSRTDYLVTERLRCSLQDLLHGDASGTIVPKPLEYATILAIAAGIAEGLAHIHSQGIFHGDLKPGNVLLDENLHPKICDFGSSGRCTPWYKGRAQTPFYMAPECEEDCCDDRPIKAEVYSLGVVMWECVQKAKPTISSQLDGEEHRCGGCEGCTLRSFDYFNPFPFHESCPVQLKDLIRGCLKKEPDQRPSLQDVILQLKGMLGKGAL